MSRSYKRTPVYKDGSDRSKVRKISKRRENRKVRQSQEHFKKSNKYRRIGNQWDIFDYRFYEAEPASTTETEREFWKKFYLRK